MNIAYILGIFLSVFALGFYTITALQWFNYSFKRVIFHYTKPLWHIYYAILPIVVIEILARISLNFACIFALLYCAIIYLWHKNIDKKLVFTKRVKRFFLLLAITTMLAIFVGVFNIALVLAVALFTSHILEKFIAFSFYKKAKNRLKSMNELTIIQITASYGKTSIKNFLYEILADEFKCYKTPRSVNTIAGLVRDVNENLPQNTQIYIAEAGARVRGDIDIITKFLRPQIVIIGEIGAQHIEYFKTVQNIRATKLEALNSDRLKQTFAHSSTMLTKSQVVDIYDSHLVECRADLEGVKFSAKFDETYEFFAPILGEFNAANLLVVICTARYLGVDTKKIQKAISKLKSVPHRLAVINAPDKFIIDDSFNGNLKGMTQSYKLASLYKGRKVLITPGIVESSAQDNATLATLADEIFDLVIVTSELNRSVFEAQISPNKLLIQTDKNRMQEMIIKHTLAGDLILFSNDAPSYI